MYIYIYTYIFIKRPHHSAILTIQPYWALMSRALVGRALRGRALMGPAGIHRIGMNQSILLMFNGIA